MLKPFTVTFDWLKGALYLDPSGPTPPFDRDRAGVRLEFGGDIWTWSMSLLMDRPQLPA
jgi:hypothetical protein